MMGKVAPKDFWIFKEGQCPSTSLKGLSVVWGVAIQLLKGSQAGRQEAFPANHDSIQ